ncbi:hypothetical protein AB0I06_07530 [Streptomyces sp. NPDC050674]|uniref:hypothetical protein n=1 Tax=Streptomyces sp. NPDC050674 TaxID=3157216 RepID=UPI0034254141
MRSARMLLATATATAALAIAGPAAYADAMGDGDHDSTSYSKEHHKDGDHHAPRGGVHTGGGALTAVNTDHDEDPSEHGKDASGDQGEEEGKHEENGKENGKEDGHEKGWEGKHEEHGKEDGHEKGWEGKHDKPRGGMHTGGGALAFVNSDDWDNPKHDPESYKDGEDDWGGKEEEEGSGDKGDWGGKQEEGGKHDKGSWEGKHDHGKPRGGMHTGGGGLASASGVTAGGLAVLAVAGTGLYALRRQRASQGAA